MEDQTQNTQAETQELEDIDLAEMLKADDPEAVAEDEPEVILDAEGNEITEVPPAAPTVTEAPAAAAAVPPAEDAAPTEKPVFTPEQQAYMDKLIARNAAKERGKAEAQIAQVNQAYQAMQQEALRQQQVAAADADATKEWIQYGRNFFNERMAYHTEIFTAAGWDPEEAKKKAHTLAQNDTIQDVTAKYQLAQSNQRLEALQWAEQERQYRQAQQVATQQKQSAYAQQKQYWLSRDPALQTYVARIDEVARGGLVSDFNTARRYVLGEMLEQGGIEALRTNAQQTAQQKQAQQKRLSVLPGSSGGRAPQQVRVTAEELRIGRGLGLTPKEIAQAKLGK